MIREIRLWQDENYNWFWEEMGVTEKNGPYPTFEAMKTQLERWIGDGA